MPLPAGFVDESMLKSKIFPLESESQAKAAPQGFESSTLPPGFKEEIPTVPQFKQSPPKGIFEKVTDYFRDPEKLTARAGNIYALSEVTGLPLREVNKNYDVLRKASEITGLTPGVDEKKFMQAMMLPGIVVGAVMNPIGTAAGLIAFGVLDKVIPTDKLIEKMEERGVSDDAIKAVEMADLVGKTMIAGGVFKKSGAIKELFLKNKITEYKLPETLTLKPEQVQDFYKMGELTTQEEKSLWAALELNSFDRKAALKNGISINVPTQKIVSIVDNPLWAKVKNMFGVSEEAAKVSTSKAGEITKGPKALLESKGVAGKTETPKTDPAQKFVSALKSAKDVRSKQETLHAAGREKQFAKLQAVRQTAQGESGFFKELGALKGELPKAQFETLRNKIGQEDIDALFDTIRKSSKIGEWEKITAQSGLAKMLGEEGGRVPTEGELGVLDAVFGKDFTSAVLAKRTLFKKMVDAGLQVANIPRSLMASFDLSAPLRQGVFLIGRQKQFGPAFKKMFGAFVKPEAYEAIQDAIISHPDYQLARDSGLSLTDLDARLGNREEQFMSSWAEKIPFLGKGVKASGRAYVGFLNKLRFDVFADLVNKAENLGLSPRQNKDLMKSLADFINNATGRGTLPNAISRSAIALNSIFFSPRLMFSRMNLLNPAFYIKQDPFVRKEALKSLFSFVGAGLTILTVAQMSGAEVSSDPRNSDFGKIRIRNTRIDVWGGFQQLVRAAAQVISGKYINSATGKEMTLGEGYRPLTRADIVQRFVEGKLAPIPSFVLSLMRQQEPGTGKPVSVSKEIGKRFVPMIMQDIFELYKEDPELMPAGLLGIFGVGVQTYSERKRKGL